MTPKDVAVCHVLDTLQQKGLYSRPVTVPGYFTQAGMGENIFEQAVSAATKLISLPAGAPSPGELYAEAVPQIQTVLKQYEKASPTIDWLLEHQYLAIALAFVLGVGSSFAGVALFEASKKKR